MKKSIYIFLAAACLSSCDSFLDEPMKGDYSSSTVYSSAEQAEQAVNAVYNAAAYSINLWKFGDIPSDDSKKGGNAGDQADLGYIDEWKVLSDNGAVAEFWQNTYETIARANNAIAGIESSSIDETVKTQLIGEAKFLRAFSYFQLVNIFGEVPLKLKPQSTEENVHVGFYSVEAIYEQIERDLTDAQVLPASYASTETGRVTKGAAYGLLAKAQLYQEKYSEALASINSLKSLNIYDLEDNYSDLFRLGADGVSNGNSIESVFALFFLSDQNPGLGTDALGHTGLHQIGARGAVQQQRALGQSRGKFISCHLVSSLVRRRISTNMAQVRWTEATSIFSRTVWISSRLGPNEMHWSPGSFPAKTPHSRPAWMASITGSLPY